MKRSTTVVWLSALIALLALIAAGSGLFWQTGGSPFSFTTLHGETVQMYGQGVYHYDSLQRAAIFRGTDAVTLVVCIPLLVLSSVLYRRGLLKGQILLTSILAYFLYNSASLAFGAAYNNLFLIYVALFSASLFAFVLAFTSIDVQSLPSHISARLPHRGIALFLFVAGLVLLGVWLGDIIGALVRGQVIPTLQSYTTEATYVIDLGIIVPVAFLAGVLLLRRAALGYVLASIMLIVNAIIGLVVVAQTVAMQFVGLTLGIGQFAAYVGSFVVLSLIAIWLAALLFRSLSDTVPARMAYA